MEKEAKLLRKNVDLLKDLVYVIALIGALFSAYHRLQQSVKENNLQTNQLIKDTTQLQIQVDKLSGTANSNSTDIKVIQTQLEILRGKQ